MQGKYYKWSFNYCKNYKTVTGFYLVISNPFNYLMILYWWGSGVVEQGERMEGDDEQ